MIKSASELLTSFIAIERAKVESISMQHMPTLGSAYEAIANAGIDNEFVLPPNLDLRVVSGFIEGLSNQIDVMLVQGEGKQYGLTPQYIYPIERVLCVMEVKKTLTKVDLRDGMDHLAGVQALFQKSFNDRIVHGEKFNFSSARENFEKITGEIWPSTDDELDKLTILDRHLFVMLSKELIAPVTILLGFDGHKTESGLRTAMDEIIAPKNSDDVPMFTPESLPSLVISGDFSLIKQTGRPYLSIRSDKALVLMGSAKKNIARILLEFIWTKIAAFCNVQMPFGTDIDYENIKEFLIARQSQKNDRPCLELSTVALKEGSLNREAVKVWEPERLTAAAIQLAEFTVLRGGILKNEKSLSAFLKKKYNVTFENAAKELVKTTIFCMRNNKLKMIAKYTVIASFDDGTGYLDTDDQRLRSWCESQGLDPYYQNNITLG